MGAPVIPANLSTVAEEEIVLPGSRLNRVVRVGDTVRRQAGPWTPAVHELLRHVRERGFELAPEPLGFDEQGREVLSYIHGDTLGDELPWNEWVWGDELLAEVGRATALYHRAVVDFRPEGVVPWQLGDAELREGELVCHHDIAPYNTVGARGRLRGLIDWDLAGPGTPLSELAFVAWQWVPLQHPFIARMFGWDDESALGRRLRLLLDSYGLEDRDGFPEAVVERMQLNRDVMVRKAAEGVPGYVGLVELGHVEGMNAAIGFVTENAAALRSQIA